MEASELKQKIFELLKSDEEFRYAVAGLLGLQEIIKRLEVTEAAVKELTERVAKTNERLETNLSSFEEHMNRLREDMQKGFARYDERFERMETKLTALGSRVGHRLRGHV